MKEYKFWEIKEINKIDDGTVVSVELRDSDYNCMSLSFKWDGCINLFKYYNGYTPDDNSPEAHENVDYIHICDLKEFIEQLQEVMVIAKDVLGKEKFERDFE